MSTPVAASSLLRAHRCMAARCSRCAKSYVDDESDRPLCFGSVSDAVRSLAEADWEITDEQVLCPECTDSDLSSLASLAICEYCSPPLFSEHELPDRCCCHQRPVVHTFVPLITSAHPGVRVRTWQSVSCTDCHEALEVEDVAMHFPSTSSAFDAAGKAGWMVAGNLNLILCSTCVNQRACASLGHSWSKEAHAVVDGIELRHCERDCGHMQHRNINESETP